MPDITYTLTERALYFSSLSADAEFAQLEALLLGLVQASLPVYTLQLYMPETSPDYPDLLARLEAWVEAQGQDLDILLINSKLSPAELKALIVSSKAVLIWPQGFSWPGLDSLVLSSGVAAFCYNPAGQALGLRERAIRTITDLAGLERQLSRAGSCLATRLQQKYAYRPDERAFDFIAARLDELKAAGLYYWGRSGTFFFHSLIDGHSEVLTFPSTVISQFYSYWLQVSAKLGNGRITSVALLEKLCQNFIEVFPVAFDSLNPALHSDYTLSKMGPNSDQGIWVDAETFKAYLLQICQRRLKQNGSVSRRDFFCALHWAYELAVHGTRHIRTKHLIFFHTHNPDDVSTAQGLLQDFPTYRAIGMRREPIAGWHSILKHQIECSRIGIIRMAQFAEPQPDYGWPELFLDGAYAYWYRHILAGWKPLQKQLGLTICELWLENLHRDPQATLKQACVFLGLKWRDSLLESTFNGISYSFQNLYDKGAIKGFSYQRISRPSWQTSFDDFDRQFLAMMIASYGRESQRFRTARAHDPGTYPAGPDDEALLGAALLQPTLLERSVLRLSLERGDERLYRAVNLNYLERYESNFKQLHGISEANTWFPDERYSGSA